jgi:hypothetical protein
MSSSTISTPISRKTTAGSSVIPTYISTSPRPVEIWFSILPGNSLKDASFTSVKQLREHIEAFIEASNENAKAFAWTKSKVHQKRLKARFADQ